MRPEEIEEKFGKEALERLYDSALDNPVHSLIDWIFHFHTEEGIAKWLKELDDMEGDA